MMITPWLIFSFFTGVASNTFNFLTRFILKDKDDPTAYAWYFELFRVIAFLIVAIFDWRLVITPYSLMLFVFLGIT